MLLPAPVNRAHDELLYGHGDETDWIGSDALLKAPHLGSVLLCFVAHRIEIEINQANLVDGSAKLQTQDMANKLDRSGRLKPASPFASSSASARQAGTSLHISGDSR
jgi:hypothetical protein